jgi:malate dehydrogenase (quinone)
MTDQPSQPQVVCVGAGIMSATLAMMLKILQPDMPITIIERLDQAAAESSDAWNNAGTGHSAFCELNYTPERADGSVEIAKAVAVAEAFEISKQLWAFLAEQQIIPAPAHFIHRTPHMSFVWGAENAAFLRRRYAALQASALFHGMRHTEDPAQIAAWAPLIMEGRDPAQPVAATHMAIGTDVNFGALTRSMIRHLASLPGVEIHFGHEVTDLERRRDRRWRVSAVDRASGAARTIDATFVFIGAGGGSLPLLLKSQIPEGRGYGGFPVSGQWLVCSDESVVARHAAKVYGRASVGAPPMSVPHLDTRMIDGRRALFFGPYAGISTKFLKHGSLLDLPLSIRANNIIPMLAAGLDNLPLTRYLIEQVTQSPEERLATLREFYPGAQREDWELQVAGQRVQVIRDDPQEGGVLEFGTEVVSAADGSLAALLGASPGASTVVSIMLTVLGRCFPDQLRSPAWQAALARMIPTYGRPLSDDPALCARTRAATGAALGLDDGAA